MQKSMKEEMPNELDIDINKDMLNKYRKSSKLFYKSENFSGDKFTRCKCRD